MGYNSETIILANEKNIVVNYYCCSQGYWQNHENAFSKYNKQKFNGIQIFVNEWMKRNASKTLKKKRKICTIRNLFIKIKNSHETKQTDKITEKTYYSLQK